MGREGRRWGGSVVVGMLVAVDPPAPAWWAVAALPAAIAALGYIVKGLVETWRDWRVRQAEALVRLLHLRALLDATHKVFDVQATLRDRLYDNVPANERHATDDVAE